MFENLKRYPLYKDDPLKPWDSADELLISEVQKHNFLGKRVLILNDSFGALSFALKHLHPIVYTDSFVSAKAIEINCGDAIKTIHRVEEIDGLFDVVLMRFPKNLSFFEDILIHLSRHIKPETKVIGTVMVKHLAKSVFDLFHQYIGETTTSLAVKKARLVFASVQKAPSEDLYPKKVKIEGFPKEFIHFSNLFSREKLDIGTRFFLDHLPRGSFKKILDLGCANGIIGIRAKELHPDADIYFSDESMMAIQSVRADYENYFGNGGHFFWTNCFESGASESMDLVLCNPPFHQQHTVGDFIAWQMFKDSHRVLKSSQGRLLVIGNTHLNYQHKLKRLFKRVEIVAQNSKFIVVSALK
jgi:23S rRNA (guanine1835-N2)-methyltransferase